MSSFEFWFDDSEDESSDDDQQKNLRIKRQKIRDDSNPLELPDTIFVAYFRLSKEGFIFLLNKFELKCNPAKRSFSVPSIVKLAAALRFFAEGSYQKGASNDFNVGVAQSTFSNILSEVLEIFENEICPTLIHFPDENERKEIKRIFFNKYGFPGIIGCVDGTHVKIISPAKNVQHLYYNRKGYHSLNVMLVCDNKMRIRFVDANNPGSSHDSFIWNSSIIDNMLSEESAEGGGNTWILGDAGYPLKPYLITPFRSLRDRGDNSDEGRFNEVHSKVRVIVERTIGVLKNTFRCLLGARELHYKPEKAIKIINVCCALHNLRIKHNLDNNEVVEIEESDTTDHQLLENDDDIHASTIRRNLMSSILHNM